MEFPFLRTRSFTHANNPSGELFIYADAQTHLLTSRFLKSEVGP